MNTDVQPDFFSAQVSEARRFYRDPRGARRDPIFVVSGGCERCDPEYAIKRTSFPFLSIEFVVEGRGAVTLGRRKHKLTPGVVFFYGPGIAQRISTEAAYPLVKYFVDFQGRQAERLLTRCCLKPGQLARSSSPRELRMMFDELIRNGLRDTPFSARICATWVELMILKIAETVMMPGAVETRSFNVYQRCLAYVDTHYLEIRTLDDMAQACGLDPAYLCRLFKRYGSQSPYRYALRLRMNHAAQLLQSSDLLIKQVAGEVGFDDPYHFSRTFRQVFGVSPREFASSTQGESN